MCCCAQSVESLYGLTELLQAAGNITGTLHYYDKLFQVGKCRTDADVPADAASCESCLCFGVDGMCTLGLP